MKLLLIMPSFFNYPNFIIEELNQIGYEVDYFDDRPSTNAYVKAVIRIKKNLLKSYVNRYFNKMMDTVRSTNYDVVFLISGQSLSFDENMIKILKESQPKARFILYQWDSQINFPYIKKVQKFFDRCYSFDKKDVLETSSLNFLPLFYCNIYEKLGKRDIKNFKYDFCFIGTAHPKKYKSITMMSEQLKKVYSKQFIYFFFPSPLVFLYRKIMNKEFKKAHYNEFHYKSLDDEEMYNIYENSKCVLDSSQDGQMGLTMRVFEALGAKKKIITTNEDIANYDFYMPENIYIYTGQIDLENVFFKTDYNELSKKIYEKYSLRNWLNEILD